MISKWYISTLILVLCVLGISKQQPKVSPNQEIVLQFSNDAVDDSVAEHAIANVKKQLQAIGVFDVNILEPEDGLLKITYYSDMDVSSIKCLLSEAQQTTIGLAFPSESDSHKTGFPSEENQTTYYDLEVFELHQANELDASLNGKLAIESRSDKDRFFYPNVLVSAAIKTQELLVPIKAQGRQATSTNAIAFNDLFLKIPEVRAGPSA